MPFFQTILYNPRKLFLRRALFQVHLWAGIFLSLYVVVIALSGAVLVFQQELTAATLPPGLSRYDAAHTAPVPVVMGAFRAAYPQCRVTQLTTPSPAVPAYQLVAVDEAKRSFSLVADPITAKLIAQPRTWVSWTHDLHYYLLLGSAYGMQVNGVGAILLLLLSVTGFFLWWQGLRNWTRGLKISLRSHWRRINFDLHHAIGIWTLLLVTWWAVSGIYFAWYRQVSNAVGAVSPLRGMVSPTIPARLATSSRASLGAILASAQAASPGGRLFGLSDPSLAGSTVFAQMDLRAPGDFSHRDIVSVDTSSARVLTVWHYGQNHTVGDWFIWSMHPLHFGTLWGFPIKVAYFLLGLSLAVLSVSGLLMYWNRYLRHCFKHMAVSLTLPAEPATLDP